jgi:hypothetical protein
MECLSFGIQKLKQAELAKLVKLLRGEPDDDAIRCSF